MSREFAIYSPDSYVSGINAQASGALYPLITVDDDSSSYGLVADAFEHANVGVNCIGGTNPVLVEVIGTNVVDIDNVELYFNQDSAIETRCDFNESLPNTVNAAITGCWRFERKYGYVWIYYQKLKGWCFAIINNDSMRLPLTDTGYDTPENALQYVREWEERTGNHG